MKKLIALLLVAVMALGLFAACGKTPVETTPKDTTPSTTAPKDTAPATTAPKAEPVYIAENSLDCVAAGAGEVLDNIDLLREVVSDSERRLG